uniref:Carbohydrate kinase PfkB domain-containing protein n=1 Tax=Ixodes ricinus TaxID=34613 RepID=A0A131Y6E1_IXORI
MALVPHIRVILVTLGPLGALLVEYSPSHQSKSQVTIVHYPARKHASVTSVSGAGDCLTGAMLCGMLRGLSWDHCLAAGLEAAQRSLASSDTVPATLGPDCFSARIPMPPRRVSLS